MTKDRLQDLRENLENPHDNHVTSHETQIIIDNKPEITDCLNEIDTIRLDIDRLDELIQEVKQMHPSMLEPRADPITLTDRLNVKKEEIRKLAYLTSSTLKRMEQDEMNGNDCANKNAQGRIKKSQIFVLTRRLRDSMSEYNRETVLQRERCKKIIIRELRLSGNRRTDDELEEFLENGCPGSLNFHLLVDVQNAQQKRSEIEARHHDIINLRTSIEKLHDMYMDLALLVTEQGELIDSIEHHVAKSGGYVEIAVEEVSKAQESNLEVIKVKTMIAITVVASVVLVLIIGYAVYLIRKKIRLG